MHHQALSYDRRTKHTVAKDPDPPSDSVARLGWMSYTTREVSLVSSPSNDRRTKHTVAKKPDPQSDSVLRLGWMSYTTREISLVSSPSNWCNCTTESSSGARPQGKQTDFDFHLRTVFRVWWEWRMPESSQTRHTVRWWGESLPVGTTTVSGSGLRS